MLSLVNHKLLRLNNTKISFLKLIVEVCLGGGQALPLCKYEKYFAFRWNNALFFFLPLKHQLDLYEHGSKYINLPILRDTLPYNLYLQIECAFILNQKCISSNITAT